MNNDYSLPRSDVYSNKLNINNFKRLNQAEKNLTGIRQMELYLSPLKGDWDLKHLQKIHHYLYQDLYHFAGEISDEKIKRASMLSDDLKMVNSLKFNNTEQLVERLSYNISEIHELNPFREGNGRATREFVRTLALSNNYELDWNKVDTKTYLRVTIASKAEPELLKNVISSSLVKNNTKLRSKDKNELER